MLKKTFVLFCGILILLIASALHAQPKGDAEKGRILSKGCMCHKNGFGNMSQEKFIKALTDFKSGKREATKMAGIVKGMSETDMADLAAYYTTN